MDPKKREDLWTFRITYHKFIITYFFNCIRLSNIMLRVMKIYTYICILNTVETYPWIHEFNGAFWKWGRWELILPAVNMTPIIIFPTSHLIFNLAGETSFSSLLVSKHISVFRMWDSNEACLSRAKQVLDFPQKTRGFTINKHFADFYWP